MSEILRYDTDTSYRMDIIPDEDEGGYVVNFPDLPGCITCGETIEEALANAEDAKNEWLEAVKESGLNVSSRKQINNSN